MEFANHTFRLSTASALAMLLASYLYTGQVHAEEARDISKVNSRIQVEANDHVGDVSSVNGSITIAQGASTASIGTVNGGIDIGASAVVDEVETVNGGIRLAQNVNVNGSLSTVNGGIRTAEGTRVERTVSTVNGKIRLRNTYIGEDIKTTNGDIELRDSSTVDGDIIVAKSSWFNRIFNFGNKRSDLLIDSGSTVNGDIHLYRKVNLRIDDDATVGEIIEHF